MDEEFENLDELVQQMERDEFEGATKLSPREFAQSIGVAPQLVYYHIRQKHIAIEFCVCGRKVVDVAEATTYFKSLQRKRTGVDFD